MKKRACLMSLLITALVTLSCSTKDVGWPDTGVNPDDLYEITDVAFAQYMVYNMTNSNADRKLPFGTVVEEDGKYYINKEVAKTVTKLYLVKATSNITELTNAGVPTAAVKIASIDGVQYFINVEEIRLTSNEITGALDLSSLSKLTLLEMNSNFVNELKVPSSITRLRYSASNSATAPENRWLTELDLSECSELNHVYLPDQKITQAGMQFPIVYENLTYVNMTGNIQTIAVPQAFYDNLTASDSGNKGGLVVAFEVPDRAFAEYLVYNATLQTTADRTLPEGSAFVFASDDKIYINPTIAATATNLYVTKSSQVVTGLTAGYTTLGFTTAATKITNMDGMQYFTAITSLSGTSNELASNGQLKLTALTELENLTFALSGVSTLDLSTLTKLKTLDVRGSSNAALGKLTAINMSANTLLESVNLSANRILPADFTVPATYVNLTFLNMASNGNGGANVLFTVPANLYNQVTNSDKANYLQAQ